MEYVSIGSNGSFFQVVPTMLCRKNAYEKYVCIVVYL